MERDLTREPLNVAELDRLIGDGPYLEFLNPRNELYRTRKMKENPPSRREAIQLMAQNPNLIRRPIIRRAQQQVLGFDPEKLAALLR
ncbi:MAG: hypothetical protein HY313_03715 [Acidobacteria bacterium]|nr:hypothetical protein [Acidobacteriota bacterium]